MKIGMIKKVTRCLRCAVGVTEKEDKLRGRHRIIQIYALFFKLNVRYQNLCSAFKPDCSSHLHIIFLTSKGTISQYHKWLRATSGY